MTSKFFIGTFSFILPILRNKMIFFLSFSYFLINLLWFRILSLLSNWNGTHYSHRTSRCWSFLFHQEVFFVFFLVLFTSFRFHPFSSRFYSILLSLATFRTSCSIFKRNLKLGRICWKLQTLIPIPSSSSFTEVRPPLWSTHSLSFLDLPKEFATLNNLIELLNEVQTKIESDPSGFAHINEVSRLSFSAIFFISIGRNETEKILHW